MLAHSIGALIFVDEKRIETLNGPNEVLSCPCGKEDQQWVKPKIAILFCIEMI